MTSMDRTTRKTARHHRFVSISTALMLAVAALGCEDRDAQAPPAVKQPPAEVSKPPKSPKEPPDSAGRVVIEIRADDKVTLHAGGKMLGTYADGPSLQAALEELTRTRPELARYAAIQLPMVFGYEAPKEFRTAIDAAGYRPAFGARLVKEEAAPEPGGRLRVLKRLLSEDDWTLAESLAGRQGDPAFVIGGPPLPRPLTVPFWIDASGWYDVFKCLDDLRFYAFALDERRIYLMQYSSMCSGSECRIYSIATGKFSKPKECLAGLTGGRFDLQRLGGDLYFLYGYMEGPGTGEVIRWTPEAGEKRLLSHITSPFPPTRSGKTFLIRSACDPLTGAVPAQESTGDCKLTPRCDYCAENFGRVFTWRWRPGAPPTRQVAGELEPKVVVPKRYRSDPPGWVPPNGQPEAPPAPE